VSYEVLGYDYSAMAASAASARSWALGFGASWAAIAVAAMAWRAKRGGWRQALGPLANAGVFGLCKLIGALGGSMVGAGVVWACWEARPWTMPNAWWAWALCLLAQDYGFYWWHRLRHQSALWWATHESHHSGDTLDLSTAFRITDAMNWFGAFLFMCPLAYLGFHPMAVAACAFAGRCWQVWTHANGWVRPGPWDRLLVTDAVHRLHHAKNLDYMDKNYGDIFTLWDQLHGTYVDPSRPGPEPRFGVCEGDPGSNPFWIAARGFVRLGQAVASQPTWGSKLACVFAPPGWSKAQGFEWTVGGMRRTRAQGRLSLDIDGVPLMPTHGDGGVLGHEMASGASAKKI
jgi:alkylglycerol monooxygenase